MLRVLAVIDRLRPGGAENLLLALARAAPDAGFEVQVATLDRPEMVAASPELDFTGLTPQFLSISRLADPLATMKLTRAITQSGCDVVHAHLEYAATLAPLAARWAGRPCVCTFHHVPLPRSGRHALKEHLAVAVANRAAAVTFVSRASMEGFAARYRARPATWSVIPNGVDLSRFSPEPARFPADLGIRAGSPIATMVARMSGTKGHDVAIGAWCTVVRQLPDAQLLLVGSGADEPRLRARCAELGLESDVVFAGFRRDIPELLRASSLVVLPSESEALPTVLIEAAACGRASIATRVGGVPEVVLHGQTGLLIDAGDELAFGRAVLDLLGDDDRREAMGRRARHFVEEQFDLRVWCRRLRRLYENVLSRGR